MSNVMTSSKHNKRRNVLLVYEFLTRHVSAGLVEGNNAKSSKALKILKKSFKQGTELYNEFRVMNALAKTTVTSEAVACSIMNEAKVAVKKHDVAKLDREKSHLIRNINHSLNDATFFDQHVSEYKTYATMQVLFNEWRNKNPDIATLASHEDSLVKWLTKEKTETGESTLSENSPGTNRLLMKIMMTKLNEKYSGTLSSEQKDLIRDYVWSTSTDDPERIRVKLNEVKSQLSTSIGACISENSGNEHMLNQLNDVRTKLINEDVSEINDGIVTRFMQYLKLNDEFNTKDEK